MTLGVFVDLSEAFDIVHHQILLQKLECYRVRGCVLQLLTGYLSCRTQYVSVGSCVSTKQYMSCGVPQGSILGPFLFLVYVNELPKFLPTTVALYADDINIFVESYCLNDLYTKANDVVSALGLRLVANKLRPIVDKSCYVLFHPKQKTINCSNPQLLFRGAELKKIDAVKFLGVFIDSHLSWSYHVEHVRKKVTNGLYALSRLKFLMSLKSQLNVCYALFHSHMSYALESYGITYETRLHDLYILQKRALCIMLRLSFHDRSFCCYCTK